MTSPLLLVCLWPSLGLVGPRCVCTVVALTPLVAKGDTPTGLFDFFILGSVDEPVIKGNLNLLTFYFMSMPMEHT